MDEDRLLLVQAEDLISRCGRQDIPVCSGFLDARQQSLMRRHFGAKQGDVRIEFFGGHKDADRVVMACLPYYMSDQEDETNSYFADVMTVIRAQVPKKSSASSRGRALSHSDYLGALMGLGIKRSVIGDILVSESGADIIVLSEMADYLLQNLTGAGKAHITAEEIPLAKLRVPDVKCSEFNDTVASLRLDAVLASAFRISRGKAAECIRQGLVFVDHLEAAKPDLDIAEGSELVIRHMGKAKLLQAGGRTRKGRISITIAKYE